MKKTIKNVKPLPGKPAEAHWCRESGGAWTSALALVAAAPDLYDALDALLAAWWNEYAEFFGADEDADLKAAFDDFPEVIAARAALAMARGEQSRTPPAPVAGRKNAKAVRQHKKP